MRHQAVQQFLNVCAAHLPANDDNNNNNNNNNNNGNNGEFLYSAHTMLCALHT